MKGHTKNPFYAFGTNSEEFADDHCWHGNSVVGVGVVGIEI